MEKIASPPSSLKLPTPKQLGTFRTDKIGDDRVKDFLANGFSLAICCRKCSRLVEWTPPDLVGRFGDRTQVRIADIAERSSCSGEDGCGSTDIAVFPHLYDQPWSWAPTQAV